jgi:hypothetical protein
MYLFGGARPWRASGRAMALRHSRPQVPRARQRASLHLARAGVRTRAHMNARSHRHRRGDLSAWSVASHRKRATQYARAAMPWRSLPHRRRKQMAMPPSDPKRRRQRRAGTDADARGRCAAAANARCTPDAERRSLLVGGAGGAQHHEEVNDRIRDVKADLEGEAHCQQPRAEVGTGASGNRRKWEQA